MREYYCHIVPTQSIRATLKTRAIIWNVLLLLLCFLLSAGCRDTPDTIASTYNFLKPNYNNNIHLTSRSDTLHFPLSENTFNEIKSFNYFENKGTSYISFYDRRSESVNIYDFSTQRRIKKIRLKSCLKVKSLYKTSVYVKNFDSIFIVNLWTLYLMDSAGTIKKNIEFTQKTDAMAFFETTSPVVIKENAVFMGVRPYLDETSFSAIDQWRALYRFDMGKEAKERHYGLPDIYRNNLYDDRFFDYGYCYNDKGNFVFSFPADTNIYETNLTDYHIAYYGRSQFQKGPIMPVSLEALKNDEGSKEYFLRDSYGPIYFDPYRKIYLRIARQKISEADYNAKNFKRTYSIIFFNQRLEIIGESLIRDEFSYNTLFFTNNGGIYAQVNTADEYALHFVRLQYTELNQASVQLTNASLNMQQ